jgi:hypothetical protein
MTGTSVRWRVAVMVPLLLLSLPLSGCVGGFRLRDENRSKLATGIKEQYAQASVLSAIEVEKKNLDRLLDEELKVVRDNHRLRVDFALLRIADGGAPMAETYARTALLRVQELGYPAFKDARASVLARVGAEVRTEEVREFAGLIKDFGNVDAPACVVGAQLPQALSLPTVTPPETSQRVQSFYVNYVRACDLARRPDPAPSSGLVRDAFAEWQAAVEEVAELDQAVAVAKKAVADRTKAHQDAQAAVTAAANAPAERKKQLEKVAADAANALKEAKGAVGLAGDRADALVVLLTAAAGGKVDTDDPKVKNAAEVVKEIPSLAGDLEGLLKRQRLPSVRNLLLELRHQVILLERASLLRGLAQQRADIAKAQYDALRFEAELWVRFSDALCSYAALGKKLPWPGQDCDDFAVTVAGASTTCTLRGAAIDECPLRRSWSDAIRKPGDDETTRELYKALAAYLQALAAQGTLNEQVFRTIDNRHRETLVTREAALRGWDNLVSIPIDQLDAYYQAGLKPAEIADLLVKALGFTAIAIGVSR